MSKLPHSAPSPVHHNTGTVAACVVQENRYKGTVFPCIWQLQGFTSAVNKKNWGLTWENNVRRQQKQHHAVPGVVSSQTSGGSLHSSWLLFYTELLSLSLIYIFHLPSNYLLLFFKTLIPPHKHLLKFQTLLVPDNLLEEHVLIFEMKHLPLFILSSFFKNLLLFYFPFFIFLPWTNTGHTFFHSWPASLSYCGVLRFVTIITLSFFSPGDSSFLWPHCVTTSLHPASLIRTQCQKEEAFMVCLRLIFSLHEELLLSLAFSWLFYTPFSFLQTGAYASGLYLE